MGRIAVFLIASMACLAQRFVTGKIGDTHGEGIPGVTVTVSAQNFFVRTSTDADGNYRVPTPTGPSTMTFEAPGFRTHTSSHSQTRDEEVLDVMMHPAPLDESEIVVFTISNAASRRPQYLPVSGLWPGELIVLTGSFGAKELVQAADDPPPRELDGYQVQWEAEANRFQSPIISVGANAITALVPEDLTDGRWNVTVTKGEQPNRGGPVTVNRGTIFF
jgi:hypothetical protein